MQKSLSSLKKELNELKTEHELYGKVIDTGIAPPKKIADVYQFLFNFFHMAISTRIEELQPLLEIENKNFAEAESLLEKERAAQKAHTPPPVSPSVTQATLPFPTAQAVLYLPPRNVFRQIETLIDLRKNLAKKILVGGGCLSELFIKNFSSSFKDIDVFIDSDLIYILFRQAHTEPNDLPTNAQEEFKILLKNFGFDFLGRETEERAPVIPQSGAIEYLESRQVDSVFHSVIEDVEVDLVFVHGLSVDFDLSFRQFFYNGGNVWCTDNAMRDIDSHKISVNSLTTPFSTLHRILQFSERYQMEIDPLSWDLLRKRIHFTTDGDYTKIESNLSAHKRLLTEDQVYAYALELSKLKLSKLDKEIQAAIDNSVNRISQLECRVRYFYELEKQNIQIEKSVEVPIPVFEFQHTEEFVSLPAEKEDEVFAILEPKLKKFRMKKMFSKDTQALFDDLYTETTTLFRDLGLSEETFLHFYTNQQLEDFLNRLLLKKRLEKNPDYSLHLYLRESVMSYTPAAIALYHSVTKKSIFLQPSTSHLLMEMNGQGLSFSYERDKEASYQLNLLEYYERAEDEGESSELEDLFEVPNKTKCCYTYTSGSTSNHLYYERMKKIAKNVLAVLPVVYVNNDVFEVPGSQIDIQIPESAQQDFKEIWKATEKAILDFRIELDKKNKESEELPF